MSPPWGIGQLVFNKCLVLGGLPREEWALLGKTDTYFLCRFSSKSLKITNSSKTLNCYWIKIIFKEPVMKKISFL